MFAQYIYLDFEILLDIALFILVIAGIFALVYLVLILKDIRSIVANFIDPSKGLADKLENVGENLENITENVSDITLEIRNKSEETMDSLANGLQSVAELVGSTADLGKNVIGSLNDRFTAKHESRASMLRKLLLGVRIARRLLLLKRKFTKK